MCNKCKAKSDRLQGDKRQEGCLLEQRQKDINAEVVATNERKCAEAVLLLSHLENEISKDYTLDKCESSGRLQSLGLKQKVGDHSDLFSVYLQKERSQGLSRYSG